MFKRKDDLALLDKMDASYYVCEQQLEQRIASERLLKEARGIIEILIEILADAVPEDTETRDDIMAGALRTRDKIDSFFKKYAPARIKYK